VALFLTHAAPTGAPMVNDWVVQCREAGSGSDTVAVFDCQGELERARAFAREVMAAHR